MKIFIKLVVLLICITCIASGRTITSAGTDIRNISRIWVSNNVPIVTNTNIIENGHTAKTADNTDSDWLSSWMYRKSHVINSSTGAGTNYQVKIRVNYGSGIDNGENVYLGNKCKTDFGDVRFTDDDETTPLDFWIQEQVDGDYAIFWVEVTDDLGTASRTIYIYYRKNDVTTTSNGDSTFTFFDDFSGDLSKWELQSSSGVYPQIESSYLRCGEGRMSDPYGWTCLGSQPTYTAFQNNAIEFRYRVASNAICEVSFRGNYVNNTGYKARSDQRDNEGQSFLKPPYRVGVWGFITSRDGDLPSIDVWYRGTITAYGSTFRLYRDDIQKCIATDIDYSGPGQISLQNHYGSYTDYDWVAVRKFTDPEPAHGNWGSEDSLLFTITSTAVGYGTITPSGQVIINNGSDTTFYITPNIGYHTDSVVVDGTNEGSPSNYTFTNVIEDHTITAYFSINNYTITATAEEGGSISPAGSIIVNYGSDTTFIITPDIGYHISDVLVDGSSVGTVSNYTFIDITDDHTINTTFEINTYTLNVTTIGNGNVTVVPEQPEYDYGTEVTLTAESEEDWTFSGWSGDVTSSDNPLMVIMDNNKSITATFTYNGILGWSEIESMPSHDPKPNKYVKDGGAMVTVGDSIDGVTIYAFRGNKSGEFYAYSPGTPGDWTELETLPYGLKPTDLTKINKKKVGKGASLCYDGDNNIIYATKGNSTREFWAYDIEGDSWTAKAFLPYTPVKGLKGGTSIAYDDYDNKVYLLAGGQKVDSSNFFVYTPQADTPNGTPWVALTSAQITPNNKPYKDGSCITLLDGEIYVLKGGDKYNYFFKYDIDYSTWSELETIPLLYPVHMIGNPKKNKVKDGGAMTNDGDEIYVIKGGSKQDLWRYTPGDPGIWTALETIPRLNKKSVPKTGAALTYGNGKLYLLKGNNTPELWQYNPSPALHNSKNIVNKINNTLQVYEPENSVPRVEIGVTPNPCTKLATIHYIVPNNDKVTIKLFSTNGRLIETLIDNCVEKGVHAISLSTTRLAKGVYFLKYQTTTHQEEINLIIQ